MRLVTAIVLLTLGHFTLADRILVIIPVASKSHHILGEGLGLALAKKGHDVTMLTTFPSGKNLTNYKELYFDGPLEYKEKELKEVMSFNSTRWKMWTSMSMFSEMAEAMWESKALNDLIHSNQQFDLIIYDLLMSDAILGVADRFKAPVIAISSVGTTEMTNPMAGNPAPASYVPSLFFNFSDEMNFFERLGNFLMGVMFTSMTRFYFWPLHDRLIHEKFPDAPPLEDLIRNISLFFYNTHFTLESPRPYMPNMIQVGGFHIVDEKLPKELKSFLDSAKEGVVLFSLGSNLKSSELPKERLNAILKTIAKFKTKFIWKFEDDSFVVPENLKILKWVPQRAVLAHPNTRALITHGGLLSTLEAVHFGIPFIGIPGFGDQDSNVAQAARREYGVRLEINDLNEETFTNALNEILNNPKYDKNIKKMSSILRGQPLTPMETAVYWVEHVLKHRGADHLKNAGLKLTWYQYYLVDVFAFLLGVLGAILWINLLILRKTFKFVKRKLSGCKSSKTKSD